MRSSAAGQNSTDREQSVDLSGTGSATADMNPVYFTCWSLARFIFATYFRWRVYHPERVPLKGSVILASNHASFLDPPLVGAGLKRPINYLARASLFRFPGFGALLRGCRAVPVERDGGGAAGLRTILDRLLAGEGIILFPEGTRTFDGKLQRAHSGIGLTVIKSTAPVVPTRVFGTYEAYGRHMRFPRPRPVAVNYGQPIYFEAYRKEAQACSKQQLKELYQQAADDIMTAIAALKEGGD